MGLRRITHANIKYVIASGNVVEQYPDNLPDPKALFMAHYDADRWLDPWTRRKE